MKRALLNILIGGCIGFTACNDSFLDKTPVTDLTEDNAFVSYDNFKSFMWPCYEIFSNTTIRTSLASNGWGQSGHYGGDIDAGYLGNKNTNGYNQFAYQTKGSTSSGNGWSFSPFVRRVNIMMKHLDAARMTAQEKDHWRAVGYFFHSYWYMELIDRFGALPWVNEELDADSPEAYGPRIDRKIVADSVLNRLLWAEQHIGDFESKDGENTINKHCVQAALSRFTLREGTWRKYHGLGDEEKYLKECVRVSKELMAAYPTLYKGTDKQPAAGYGEMWTTEDLKDIPGVILYKSYVDGINPVQGGCYIERTATHYVEMPQYTVDLYLMKNGKPIHNANSGYHWGKDGDKSMYATFRDRDPRLYHIVIPPYKVTKLTDGTGEFPTWSYTGEEKDREFIDIMGANETCSNPGVGMKHLPAQNWSADLAEEVPRLGTGAFITCRSGYYVYKLSCDWEKNFNAGTTNVADKPIFKIEEVILNYAEACCELNIELDEAVSAINKLRDRAGVDPMVRSEINENFDPDRPKWYPKDNISGVQLDPLLWEIRRERIIELMGEGFGFYDIRRWRMAPWFLNRAPVGIWATKEFATKNGMTLYNPETGFSDGGSGSMTEGNLFLFNNPVSEGKGWLEKYYLYQVPTDEILLNPNLAPNNPGWE